MPAAQPLPPEPALLTIGHHITWRHRLRRTLLTPHWLPSRRKGRQKLQRAVRGLSMGSQKADRAVQGLTKGCQRAVKGLSELSKGCQRAIRGLSNGCQRAIKGFKGLPESCQSVVEGLSNLSKGCQSCQRAIRGLSKDCQRAVRAPPRPQETPKSEAQAHIRSQFGPSTIISRAHAKSSAPASQIGPGCSKHIMFGASMFSFDSRCNGF